MTTAFHRAMRAALPLLFVLFAILIAPAAETPAPREGKPLFTPEEVRAYVPKGPSQRYRYYCSDYNLVI